MHLGGASMALHRPDSWQTTEVVMGPWSLNPGLHWYWALAPRVKSWPKMLPLTGGTGIPQDSTGGKAASERVNAPFSLFIVV